MALQAGTRLGPYEVLSLIGAGGMGEVYRARDTRLARDVALKILRSSIADDPTRLSRLTREAQVLASLNHPHIGAIYGLEEFEGFPALVLELVEGDTLADRIARGPMPVAEVLPLATQIAEALEAAHEQGIVHRDLKPANIKLRPDGTVKVLDFGLAKALDPTSASSHEIIDSPTYTVQGTAEGTILGTAPYMAPEQARGLRVDKRADIWAFGVVLYEMLTAHRPFGGPTVSDTLAAILTTQPSWEVLPAAARSLVQHCLRKDPKQRLRDVGDVRITLSDITNSSEATADREKRGFPVLVNSIALLIAAVSVTLLVVAVRRQPQPSDVMRLSLNLGPRTHFPAVSPDGTCIVYARVGSDGVQRLYKREFDNDEAEPLRGTEEGDAPFFSPDGKVVGFFARQKLQTIATDGGGPVVLCDAPNPRGGTWIDPRSIIAALEMTGGLSRVPIEGGAPDRATELNRSSHEITHRWPQALGSEAVLFTAHSRLGGYEDATIEAQSLRTGERKTLIRGAYHGRYVATGHLLFLREKALYAARLDVNHLALAGPVVKMLDNVEAVSDLSRTGTLVYTPAVLSRQVINWLDRTGETQSLLPLEQGTYIYWGFNFSPDGLKLALGIRSAKDGDLWVYDRVRGIQNRITSTTGWDGRPVWTPDGTHIVFASERHGGPANLYWTRADGTGDTARLTVSENVQEPNSFAPDGRTLVFREIGSGTQSDLWTLPVTNPTSDDPEVGAPQPLLRTTFNESDGAVSPDGQWLAYASDESGRTEVYVQAFPGRGGKWLVSTGGSWPVWSHTESRLFYRSADGLMLVPYAVKGQAFTPRKPETWVKKLDVGLFALAPDGRRFAVAQYESSGEGDRGEFRVLLNILDEVRRRADVAR